MKLSKVILNDISEKIDYGYTASSTTDNVGPKFLRITDIQNDRVDWNAVPFCKCSDEENRKYSLNVGDIVFARTGATTGKSFVLRNCPVQSVFASYLIRVRPNKSLVDPMYLSYYFRTQEYWDQILGAANGSTQPGVNASNLKQLKIFLPPLPEQKRIVPILDKADAVRRKRQETIRLLDEFLRSVFLEMFGDPVRNEKGWEVKKLIEISTQITDGVHFKPNYTDNGVPFVSVNNITTGELKFDDCKYISKEDHEKYIKRCKPEYHDLLYTKVGATYGRPAIINTKDKFSIYVSVALIKPKKEIVNPYYLKEIMRSHFVKRQADECIKGIGVPDLHLVEIKNFNILLPPVKYQEKFVQIVEKIERQKELLEKSLLKIENGFNSLMQKAFRGEL